MNFYLELLEIYKNDNFSWGHFAWTTWWTWHYVSNLLLFYLQKMSLSKTKSELLLPVHQLCIRIRKKWKIWIFEIHYASYILNSKVKFKYCLILLQNWFFMAKTEWEKCTISDILDKLTKLFHFWISIDACLHMKPIEKYNFHLFFILLHWNQAFLRQSV